MRSISKIVHVGWTSMFCSNWSPPEYQPEPETDPEPEHSLFRQCVDKNHSCQCTHPISTSSPQTFPSNFPLTLHYLSPCLSFNSTYLSLVIHKTYNSSIQEKFYAKKKYLIFCLLLILASHNSSSDWSSCCRLLSNGSAVKQNHYHNT